MNLSRTLQAAQHGFQNASPAERASFGISSATAITLGIARLITNVQERKRPVPGLRSLTRRAFDSARDDGARVHHFFPGMLVAGVAGATAIVTRKDGRELWFSIPFGTGAGLVLDEVALLLRRDNPYWGSERLVLIEAGTTALTAATLGARFLKRGASVAG